MRKFVWCGVVVCTGALTSACSDVFQNFGPVESHYVYNMPVANVANQVRCELNSFIRKRQSDDKKYEFALSRTDADVKLNLQSQYGGYVQYLGIDFNRLGFTSLADLVTASQKTPSLGAKVSPTSTVYAEVAMKVPQKLDKKESIRNFCKQLGEETSQVIKKLYIEEWLTNFFDKARAMDGISMSTVKLHTDFVIAVDINSGVNPFFGNTYLLPISGLNVDFNPKFTHSLDITLNLCKPDSKTGECPVESQDKLNIKEFAQEIANAMPRTPR